ncbi:General transcription factor IIE TFIIE subunit [Balamuthia mandrillaris]
MAFSTDAEEKYSLPVGFIFVFNLIIGAGALNLPLGFEKAGLVLGSIFLAFLAFLSYVCITYIIEAQASANALLALTEQPQGTFPSSSSSSSSALASPSLLPTSSSARLLILEDESVPLLRDDKPKIERVGVIPASSSSASASLSINATEQEEETKGELFTMKRRVEMSAMAQMFLGKYGPYIFYVILVIYLYGDLAIYAVSIPQELTRLTGGWAGVSDDDVYYVYLAGFIALLGPLCFFNFQKTKYLQLVTMALRNIAFGMMIIIAFIYIGEGKGAKPKDLKIFNIGGLPELFGVAIYSFMCHHSLPSLLTPIANKKQLNKMMFGDVFAILIYYCTLCISAVFAFGDEPNRECEKGPGPPCKIQDLYTENFLSYDIRAIAYFLNLFPVFSLSSNFPLIAITLRNNLMHLFPEPKVRWYKWVKQPLFSLLAITPPFAIAFGTRNVSILVSFTGSYAGLFIMFVIPALLLFFSRRKVRALLSSSPPITAAEDRGGEEQRDAVEYNPHRSVFGHWLWLALVLLWSVAALALVTFNHIYSFVKK